MRREDLPILAIEIIMTPYFILTHSSPSMNPIPIVLRNCSLLHSHHTDVETYYREEFSKLSEGEELIGYGQLLEWTDLKQMLESGEVEMEQVSLVVGTMEV